MTRSSATISTEAALRILADRHRRELLVYLIETDGEQVTVENLTATLDTAADPRDTAIALHHHHLPMLSNEGVIEWDPNVNAVRYRECGIIEDLLEAMTH